LITILAITTPEALACGTGRTNRTSSRFRTAIFHLSFAKTPSDAMRKLGPQRLSWARAFRFEDSLINRSDGRMFCYRLLEATVASMRSASGPAGNGVAPPCNAVQGSVASMAFLATLAM